MKVALILLMGGSGSRFGATTPKQFLTIDGTPIYRITLDQCLSAYPFAQIVLASHPEWIDEVGREVSSIAHLTLIEGGKSRQDSSYKALQALNSSIDIALIHDSVRPFVTPRIIQENIDTAAKHGAADTCIPTTDTIVSTHDGYTIDHIPDRKLLWRGQTPQTFQRNLIIDAHRNANGQGIFDQTDDCGLVHAMGEKVAIVRGDESNMKITHTSDLPVATFLYRQQLHLLDQKIPPHSLDGKRFAITGGRGTLATHLKRLLEEEGAHVYLLDRTSLSHAEACQRSFAQLGGLNGLINTMGSLEIAPLNALDAQTIESQIYDNFTALVLSCRYANIVEGGHILNIGSSASSQGRPDYVLYSSSKAAVINFTEGLAKERTDLFVNVLSPGRMDTPMRRLNFPQESDKRLLDPAQVAKKAINILKQSATGSHVEYHYEGTPSPSKSIPSILTTP